MKGIIRAGRHVQMKLGLASLGVRRGGARSGARVVVCAALALGVVGGILGSDFDLGWGVARAGALQTAGPAAGGGAADVGGAPLTGDQVVANMVRRNAERAEALRAYKGKRTYNLEYHGFPLSKSAQMVVTVDYRAPASKEFVVESETGSKLVIDRVFKRLLQTEKEALQPENMRRTALTPENYNFKLVGYESGGGGTGPLYVLAVEPRSKNKLLYRGRIWVHPRDFAVVRIKAEPAVNPSFWIKATEIEHEYVKVSDFWLPLKNRSVTAVRLGGKAELTIEYKEYVVTGAR